MKAEFFCGIAVVFGFATRLALVPLIINMAVALFAFHLQRGDPYKVMELALVYLVVWVSLFITGPGRFSLDGLILKKARSAPCAE